MKTERIYLVRLTLVHGPTPEVLAPGTTFAEALAEAARWWSRTYPKTSVRGAKLVKSSGGPIYATPGVSKHAEILTEPVEEVVERPTDHVRLARLERAVRILARRGPAIEVLRILEGIE